MCPTLAPHPPSITPRHRYILVQQVAEVGSYLMLLALECVERTPSFYEEVYMCAVAAYTHHTNDVDAQFLTAFGELEGAQIDLQEFIDFLDKIMATSSEANAEI